MGPHQSLALYKGFFGVTLTLSGHIWAHLRFRKKSNLPNDPWKWQNSYQESSSYYPGSHLPCVNLSTNTPACYSHFLRLYLLRAIMGPEEEKKLISSLATTMEITVAHPQFPPIYLKIIPKKSRKCLQIMSPLVSYNLLVNHLCNIICISAKAQFHKTSNSHSFNKYFLGAPGWFS